MRRNCPSDQELLAFHLGHLPDAAVEAVAAHLEACADCEAAVQQLDGVAADQVLSVLRKTRPASSAPPSRAGRALVSPPDPTRREHWPCLPGYEILATLGRGGMGVVYKARQLRLNRLVALKQLRSGEREAARARVEAEALARLQHPNIVQIHEVFEFEARTYLTLEFVQGGSLQDNLSGRPKVPRGAAALLETLARAVHHAHLQGIVHRDLKPANILLAAGEPGRGSLEEGLWSLPATRRPPPVTPKISDFGLAKILAGDSGETRDGDVIGTASYMSPEQAGGKVQALGPATDVYSLGVVLYELLTGRVPLQGPTSLDTLVLVRTEEPVAPRRLQPHVPRDLETICLKCLEKEPSRRYATALELADDLRRFLDHKPIHARPTGPWERAWKWAKRRPLVAGLSAALVLVAALGFGLVTWQWRRAENEAKSEAQAHQLARDRERRADEARRQLEKLSAGVYLDQGSALCERGELRRGLLGLAHSLELAHRAGDADLERAARVNLAGWLRLLVRQRAECGHKNLVMDLSFSPDGRTLLTCSLDGTARLWDAATGKLRLTLDHHYQVWSAAFSPDGKEILTGGRDEHGGVARLWDAATGKLLDHQPSPQPELVYGVAYSRDGKRFFTVSPTQVCLWTADARPIGAPMKHAPAKATGRHAPIGMAAAFSPDGKLVATGSEAGTVRFWDAATGAARGKPLRAPGPVLTVLFSPDSRTLLTGCYRGGAQLWDVAAGKQRGPTLQHAGRVMAADFSPDGSMVATGGAIEEDDAELGIHRITGGEVRLWRADNGFPLGNPLWHPKPVWSLAFSPGGRLLLTGCEDGMARFFLTANGLPLGEPLGHEGTVRAIAFRPDGTAAATAAAGGDQYAAARLWELPPERLLPQPLLQRARAVSLAFSPDGKFLLTGGDDRSARLWDLGTGRPTGPPLPLGPVMPRAVPGRNENVVLAVAFSPDGRSFLTFTETGELRLWDRATGRPRWVDRDRYQAGEWAVGAAFRPDGRTIVTGTLHGKLRTFEAATGKEVGGDWQAKMLLFTLAFRPDGRRLLALGLGWVWLWDPDTHKLLWSWRAKGWCDNGSFLPGGDKILVVDAGFPKILDAATGRELAPPRYRPEGAIRYVTPCPDGRAVLVHVKSGAARLLDVATGKPLGPPLTRAGDGRVAVSRDGATLAAGARVERVIVWKTPRPVGGGVDQVRLWVETLTGMELDAQDSFRTLSAAEVKERRQRLEKLGGPPAVE